MLLVGCRSVPASSRGESVDALTRPFPETGADGLQLSIATNRSAPLEVELRFSLQREDTYCERGRPETHLSISEAQTTTASFQFSRSHNWDLWGGHGEPRTLYEWHACLVVDRVVYKAWRGFDPGPGSRIDAECVLSHEVMTNKGSDKYLCRATRVTHDLQTFSEFASYCWAEDVCLRFETEAEYDLFRKRGPENAAFFENQDTPEVASAEVLYRYAEDDEAEVLIAEKLASVAEVCPDAFADRPAAEREEICRNELVEWREALETSDEWRHRLDARELRGAFPELQLPKVRSSDERGPKWRTFAFEPHAVDGHSVSSYWVSCRDEERLQRARCTVSVTKQFQSGDSTRPFSIGDTTDVPTALWASVAYRKSEMPRFEGPGRAWVESLDELGNLSFVAVDGRLVILRFSQACTELTYRILGDNEGLEPVGARPGGFAYANGGNSLCLFN